MCARVCMCVVVVVVVDADKLVNTHMLFDTPGGLEDISQFFSTYVPPHTFSSSSSLSPNLHNFPPSFIDCGDSGRIHAPPTAI